MRVLFQLGLLVAFGAFASSCIITEAIHFDPPAGIDQSGSCMCAVCWDRPFCESGATGEFVTRALPTDPCPNDMLGNPMEASTASTRVAGFGLARGAFHCIQPMGRDVDATDNLVDGLCPVDDILRAHLENVDPCIDIPIECRPRTGVDCHDPIPPTPCPPEFMVGATRRACGDNMGDESLQQGQIHATDKLITECGIWGRDVPNGAHPSRYCYVACIQDFPPGSGGGLSCNPLVEDPPEITQSSFPWHLDPAVSGGTIRTPAGEVVPVGLAGQIYLHAPRCAALVSCPVSIPWLEAYVPGDLVVGGYTVHEARLQNPAPIFGATFMIGSAASSPFQLDAGAVLYVTGDVEGHGISEFIFTAPSALIGEINWTLRTFVVTGTFTHSSGAALDIEIHGAIPNLLPIANAGPDQTLECTSPDGAVAHVSALASRDPDGGIQDMISAWWTTQGNAFDLSINGFTADLAVPLGSRHYDLVISDRWGAMSADEVVITVQDTAGPIFETIGMPAGDCLPSDEQVYIFHLGSEIVPQSVDVCSAFTPTYRIVGVASNQPDTGPADVAFGQNALCVRGEQQRRSPTQPSPRTYTVLVQATDEHGNSTTSAVQIHVPDRRAGETCPNGNAAVSTVPNINDPRCTTGGPPPTCQCRTSPIPMTAFPLAVGLGVIAVAAVRRGRRRSRS